MKYAIKILLLIIVYVTFADHVKAQQPHKWEDISHVGFYRADTTKKHGYTLIFINKDSTFMPLPRSGLRMRFGKYIRRK